MTDLVFKSYPDGTGSVTRKKRKLKVESDHSCRWDARSAARREAVRVLGATEVARLIGVELGVSEAAPFSCQEEQKSVNDSKPLRMGLTVRGQKQLRRAFAAWDTRLPPGTCAFGTLTLSPDAVSCVLRTDRRTPAQKYQGAVSRFMERLRKLLRSRGLPGDVIWVTELHPQRSQREGIAIPHVHFVCQTATVKYQWLIKPSEIKALWESAINAYAPSPEGKRFPSRCEIKCVKKSVSRYLSKYLSKAKRCAIQNTPSLNTELVPQRWYAIANELHALVRKMTAVISGDEAGEILDWLKRRGNPIVKRCGDITIPQMDSKPVWLASWFIFHCPIDSDAIRLLVFG